MSSATIGLGAAAAAIPTTPRNLHSWLNRYDARGLKLTAAQQGERRTFGRADVAILAVMKRLIGLGIPAPTAYPIALKAVRQRWPGLFSHPPAWVPEAPALALSRRGSGWGVGAGAGVVASVPVALIVAEAFNRLGAAGHPLPLPEPAEAA